MHGWTRASSLHLNPVGRQHPLTPWCSLNPVPGGVLSPTYPKGGWHTLTYLGGHTPQAQPWWEDSFFFLKTWAVKACRACAGQGPRRHRLGHRSGGVLGTAQGRGGCGQTAGGRDQELDSLGKDWLAPQGHRIKRVLPLGPGRTSRPHPRG